MNRKPWPILVGIVLVLALAATALLGRLRPAAPTATLSLTFAPSPTRSPPDYRLPTTYPKRLRHPGGGERRAGGDYPPG